MGKTTTKKTITKPVPKVVEASSDVSDNMNDLIASSSMLHDAFMDLVNTDKVNSAVSILEKALENANEIQVQLRELKKKEGVKDLSRYFGYYDIAIEDTTSDIPAEDTIWGHGPSKLDDPVAKQNENSVFRAGKTILRIYSSLERPLNSSFKNGGCELLLSRGTSITQTKGNRIYRSAVSPLDLLGLIGSMSLDSAKKLWSILAASYAFNKKLKVAISTKENGSIKIENIEELDLSGLD